jgi:hypothetical protein
LVYTAVAKPTILNMADLTENEKLDYQNWFVEGGEAGFSPDRNKFVVEESIKKHNAMRMAKRKAYIEGLAERVDAVRTWAKSLTGSHMPAEKYFGRRQLAYLQGQKILQTLQIVNGKKIVKLDSLD